MSTLVIIDTLKVDDAFRLSGIDRLSSDGPSALDMLNKIDPFYSNSITIITLVFGCVFLIIGLIVPVLIAYFSYRYKKLQEATVKLESDKIEQKFMSQISDFKSEVKQMQQKMNFELAEIKMDTIEYKLEGTVYHFLYMAKQYHQMGNIGLSFQFIQQAIDMIADMIPTCNHIFKAIVQLDSLIPFINDQVTSTADLEKMINSIDLLVSKNDQPINKKLMEISKKLIEIRNSSNELVS